jgi:hypothetical protein
MLTQEKVSLAFVNISDLFLFIRRCVLIENKEYEVLDEKVLFRRSGFKRVRRWIRGAHPNLNGTLIKGYTGWETIIEQDLIIPSRKFIVE